MSTVNHREMETSMNTTAGRAQRVLLRRRVDLARLRTKNVAEEAEALSARSADWPDLAAERETAEVLEQLSERERVELVQIEEALERVKEGTYGRCRACGGAIGKQRLRAVPHASMCFACESAAERH